MANAYIQVPPQSTGLKVQTFENVVGGQTVEAEAVTLVQSSDNTEVGTAAQPLRTDPTGSTTQPVSGTVAIGAGSAVIGHVIADTGSTTAVTGNVAVTNAGLTNIDVALSTRTKPADQQHAIIDSGTVTAVTSVTNPVSTKTALTASAPTAATVGVASAQAVAAAATRKGLVLVNTSANTISLGFGATAVLGSGITLNASGGTFVMDEFTFHVGAVNAIASAASSNLAVQEYTT